MCALGQPFEQETRVNVELRRSLATLVATFEMFY
jgi:hypothetical protein